MSKSQKAQCNRDGTMSGWFPCNIDAILAYYASLNKISGAPNDRFLSNPLKRNFRPSGVPLKLCRFISGRAIIFLSVRSF